MSTPRQRIEAALGEQGAFGFLDLAPPQTAEAIAACTEARLQAEHDAVEAALADALPRIPNWLRGFVGWAMEVQS